MKIKSLLIFSFLVLFNASLLNHNKDSDISSSFLNQHFDGSSKTDSPSNFYLGFMQLSSRSSHLENENLYEKNKLFIVSALTFLSLLICCGLIQAALSCSKRTNAEYLTMQTKYKEHQGLMKFKEFYTAYSQKN